VFNVCIFDKTLTMNIKRREDHNGKVIAITCDLVYKGEVYEVILDKATGRVRFSAPNEKCYTHYQQVEFKKTQMIGNARDIALEMIIMSGR
jgi:hypothetical protein